MSSEPLYIQIFDHITQKGIKLSWVADNLSISKQHLSLILKGKKTLSAQRVEQINIVLGTEFKLSPEILPHEDLEATKQSLKEKPLFNDDNPD
jgi:hypothetical protein